MQINPNLFNQNDNINLNSDITKEIKSFVDDRDYSELKKILDNNKNILKQNQEFTKTCLIELAKDNTTDKNTIIDIVHLILENCDDFRELVNANDETNTPLLYHAVHNGHYQIAQFLIKNGADATGKNPEGQSILEVALKQDTLQFNEILQKDYLQLMKLILEGGANPNQIKTKEGVSVLFLTKSATVMRLLIELGGVDPRGQDEHGVSLFAYAIMALNIELARYLAQSQIGPEKLPVTPIEKKTIELESVKFLIENQPIYQDKTTKKAQFKFEVNPNEQLRDITGEAEGINNVSLLQFAIGANNPTMVHLLLQLGANPNTIDKEKNPVILQAIKDENIQIVHHLLEFGADPNILTSEGNPILLEAINTQNHALVKRLLMSGVDVNVCKKDGLPLLSCAILTSTIKIVKLLLKNGANPNFNKNETTTNLGLALAEKDTPVAKLLLRYGADMHATAKWKFDLDAEANEDLPRLPLGIEFIDMLTPSYTMLQLAISSNNLEMIKCLYALGIEKAPSKETLQFALKQGCKNSIFWYLIAHADQDAFKELVITPYIFNKIDFSEQKHLYREFHDTDEDSSSSISTHSSDEDSLNKFNIKMRVIKELTDEFLKNQPPVENEFPVNDIVDNQLGNESLYNKMKKRVESNNKMLENYIDQLYRRQPPVANEPPANDAEANSEENQSSASDSKSSVHNAADNQVENESSHSASTDTSTSDEPPVNEAEGNQDESQSSRSETHHPSDFEIDVLIRDVEPRKTGLDILKLMLSKLDKEQLEKDLPKLVTFALKRAEEVVPFQVIEYLVSILSPKQAHDVLRQLAYRIKEQKHVSSKSKIFELLLSKIETLDITEDTIHCALLGGIKTTTMQKLLQQHPIKLTKSSLEHAMVGGNPDLVIMILEEAKDIEITQDLLWFAVKQPNDCLEALLPKIPKNCITTDFMRKVLEKEQYIKAFILLCHAKELKITNEILDLIPSGNGYLERLTNELVSRLPDEGVDIDVFMRAIERNYSETALDILIKKVGNRPLQVEKLLEKLETIDIQPLLSRIVLQLLSTNSHVKLTKNQYNHISKSLSKGMWQKHEELELEEREIQEKLSKFATKNSHSQNEMEEQARLYKRQAEIAVMKANLKTELHQTMRTLRSKAPEEAPLTSELEHILQLRMDLVQSDETNINLANAGHGFDWNKLRKTKTKNLGVEFLNDTSKK